MSFTVVCYKYFKAGNIITNCSRDELRDVLYETLVNYLNNDFSFIKSIKLIHNNRDRHFEYRTEPNVGSVFNGINFIVDNCAYDGGNVFIEIHEY